MSDDPGNIDLADIDADSTPPPADWAPEPVDDEPDPADVLDLDEDADE